MDIKTDKEEYIFGKNISLVMPSEIGKKIEKCFQPLSNFFEEIKLKLRRDITEESIKIDLSNARILTLQLTQNCNLRCSYCGFGGNYKTSRTHSNKKMTLDTARKAIDFFFETVSQKYRSRKDNIIHVSFYGGEVLLEYETLVHSVEYAKEIGNKLNFKVEFNLTTNGVLLTPDKLKWFVDMGFFVDISLDGPQEEHDRFRLDVGGNGTFLKIMENIRQIKKNHPDYYEKKLRFFVTVHPFHDIGKMEDFFLAHPDLFNAKQLNINSVKLEGLDVDLKKELSEARKKQLEQKSYTLHKDKWFYFKIVDDPIDRLFFSGNGTNVRLHNSTFTGACFPGGLRVFVSVDGSLHVCEKIDESFGIGDIFKGFDIKKIKIIIDSWINQIEKMECWDCDCASICSFCYASKGSNGHFLIKKEDCEFFIDLSRIRLKEYLNLKEFEDEKMDIIHPDNIDDYLELL